MRQLNKAVVLALFTLFPACSDDEDLGTDPNPSTASDGGDAGRDASAPLDGGTSNMDAAVGSDAKVDRSALANLPKDGGLDYSDKRFWACHPDQGNASECRVNLDVTEIAADGGRKVIPHVVATAPKFDCFYVYPTVALTGGGNMTNFADIRPVLDPLLSQGARFNRMCEVYAPLYRQVALATTDAGTAASEGADPVLAVNDVLASFDEYIAKWNKGRPFVILGHSQGSSMSIEILKRRIDTDAQLRSRFVSAVILGGGPVVPDGQSVGGSFKNIPTCEEPGDTGCVIAWVTFAKEHPPTGTDRFGKASAAGRVICSDPAKLNGNTGNYKGSYFRLSTNNSTFANDGKLPEGITTPFVLYPDLFKGQCVRNGDYNYLEVEVNKAAGDVREPPPYRNARLENTGWGLHLVDWNLAYEDVLSIVEKQATSVLSKQ